MVEVIHHCCHQRCDLANFYWMVLNFAVFDLIRYILDLRLFQKLLDEIVSQFTAFNFTHEPINYWILFIKFRKIYRNNLENNFNLVFLVRHIFVYKVGHVPYALIVETTIYYYHINIILNDPPYFDKRTLKLSFLNLLVHFPVLCKLPVYNLLNYVLLLSLIFCLPSLLFNV